MEELFFAAAFLAEVAGTMAGFGSSTIFLPLALFFVDFKTALVLVALFHLFGNLGRIALFRHGLNGRLLLHFGLPSVILTLAGALLVALAGSYTGRKLLERISQATFRKRVLAAIALISLKLIYDGASYFR
ncbi:MAG TPA: TSUP family transporter [Candidatus Norongarragalinales archaeon]|nr:TSUP family transporter [Candidatus Norongarragalinales archaeon]